jgi:ATP-binding cassette, subfamily C (CFTR/MRP), member 4
MKLDFSRIYQPTPVPNHSNDAAQEDQEEKVPDNIWDNAPFYYKWTYIVVNPFLRLGESKTLQLDDLLNLSKHDYMGRLLPRLMYEYSTAKKFFIMPKLMVAMLNAHQYEHLVIIFLTIIELSCIVLLPVMLFYLLQSLADDSGDAENYKWAAILGGLSIVQTITHHIVFFFTMRLGWNWRSSVMGLIYDRLFHINGNMKSNYTTGKLVNLISNDVARFEEFAVVSSLITSSLF